ncbi:hypothetical protein Q7413_10505, partial [Glaesserella parasuis]|nr:hypothetical protein [Glaesserella parasuis]MDP0237441.1 hypothetical protein [Glaesserella parasuis]
HIDFIGGLKPTLQYSIHLIYGLSAAWDTLRVSVIHRVSVVHSFSGHTQCVPTIIYVNNSVKN